MRLRDAALLADENVHPGVVAFLREEGSKDDDLIGSEDLLLIRKGPGQKYFAGLGVKLSLDSDATIERNRSPFREPLRISRLRRVRRV